MKAHNNQLTDTAMALLYWDRMVRRFWSRVEKQPGDDGCWLWKGKTGRRYGQFDGRQASHVAWELTNKRPLPAGTWLLHRCDNPPCVRPSHLFEGDQTMNMRDAQAKGRTRGTFQPLNICRRGHRFDATNTYWHVENGKPRRRCRACREAQYRSSRKQGGQR